MEVRSYSGLFSVEEPSDDWEVELNPTSEQVVRTELSCLVFSFLVLSCLVLSRQRNH